MNNNPVFENPWTRLFENPWTRFEYIYLKNLKLYVKILSKSDKVVLAKDVATNPDILAQLALEEDYDITCYVARNIATPAETLAQLSVSSDWRLRSWVAENISTPGEILMQLTQDSLPFTRLCLLSNSILPEGVLQRLREDTSGMVQDGLKQYKHKIYCGKCLSGAI